MSKKKKGIKSKPRLTEKQKRFVKEYLIDANATQAAIRAGYNPRSATEIGAENLRKPHIFELINQAQMDREKRTEITGDDIVRELARIAFSDPRSVMTWGEADPDTGLKAIDIKPSDSLTDDEAAVIQSISEVILPTGGVKFEVKMNNKVQALHMLAKIKGMYIDKKEVTANVRHEAGELTKETEDKIRKEILGIPEPNDE